jgi:hypothetical protein
MQVLKAKSAGGTTEGADGAGDGDGDGAGKKKHNDDSLI